MLPLLAAIFLWSIFHIWRLRLNDKIRARLNPSWESLRKHFGVKKLRPGWRSEKLISKAINGAFLGSTYDWCSVAFFLGWLGLFLQLKAFELFERPAFATLYKILFCSVILLILISAFRLAHTWQELRRFLLELKRQRANVVFTRVKQDWPSIWYYGSEDPDWDYMVRSDETLRQLRKDMGNDSPFLDAQDRVAQTVTKIRRTRRKLQDVSFWYRPRLDKLEAKGHYCQLENYVQEAQERLAETLNLALDRLRKAWKEESPWLEEEDSEEKREDRPVIVHCKEQTDGVPGWQKLLEKYVALRYVAFIRAVIARIRLLLIFLAVSFSLALISLLIYSFEPHRALIWLVTAIFVVIGYISVSVLMQIHRDPILSRITGTKPNELGLMFYVRIAALGVPPALTLLATHFPSIGRFVVSFLQPGLEALK
jgi:hypothetical protein